MTLQSYITQANLSFKIRFRVNYIEIPSFIDKDSSKFYLVVYESST